MDFGVNYCDRLEAGARKRLPVRRVARNSVDMLYLLPMSVCFVSLIVQVPISCLHQEAHNSTKLPLKPVPGNHLFLGPAGPPHLMAPPNLYPTINPQLFAAPLVADRRTEPAAPLPRPGRLLADYVSHQGQRILKNLVNTTIADLVAQSTVRIVNPNKQHSVAGGGGGGGGPFPAMGRLYTLLFPTPAPNATSNSTLASASTISSQQVEGEQKEAEFAEQPAAVGEPESAGSGDSHFSSSAEDQQTTLSSQDMRGHLMSMSMGAPYDPRSRGSSSAIANEARGMLSSGSLQLMSSGGGWHRPSSSVTDAGLMQDSQSGLFLTSGSEQHIEASSGEEAPAEAVPSAELVDADSLANSYGEQVQATAHSGAVDVQQATDGNDQDHRHNPVDQVGSELADFYRPPTGAEPQQQVAHKEVDLSPPSTPEEESFVAPISQQLVEAEMMQPGAGNETTLEQASSAFALAGSDEFGDQFTQTTNLTSFEHQVAPSDESYFTAHLPVQYETALRPPPEGHYDDYFKLLSSAGSGAADSELQNQLASYGHDEAAFFGANSNEQLGNRSARHFLTQSDLNNSTNSNNSKLESELSSYLPVRRPRDHNSINFEGPNGTGGLQYEVQHIYERIPYNANQSSSSNVIHELGTEGGHQTRGARPEEASRYEPYQARNLTAPSDDNLQVIIAKTNYGRDPMSPEKVINYTSENHNFTWSGKSPRNHFVNKDMNEMPVEPLEPPPPPPPPQPPVGSATGAGRFGGPGLPISFRPSLDVGAAPLPGPPLVPPMEQHYIVGNLASGSIRSPQPTGQFDRLMGQVQQPQMVQIVEIGPKQRAGQPQADTADQQMRLADAIQTIVGGQQHQSSASRQDQHLRGHLRPSSASSAGERKRPKGTSKRERRLRGQKPHRSSGGSAANKAAAAAAAGQPQRPQVTQVHLEQQNEPATASASSPDAAGQETGESDEPRLAGKMKQLREHPPDKNELMNELLSALDRVKVAIYKLQPLTAKMNAIYRKSVTSNTRDTIMDKHKGTYAKRYPPGDYDDTYDRIQPTEIAQNSVVGARSSTGSQESAQSHQASSLVPDRSAQPVADTSTMSSSEVTDEPIPRVGAELEASDSGTRAIYMRAPHARLLHHTNKTASRAPPRRWRRRVTSMELDQLDAAESRVIATGIGRRFGDRELGAADDDKRSSAEETPVNSSSPDLLSLSPSSFAETPLFGYRITIYQKPTGEGEADDADSLDTSKFAYRVDGLTEPLPGALPTGAGQQELEPMTTSESSVVDFKAAAESEAGSSEKKAAAGGKRDHEWKKSDSGRKEEGKESKSQKEFKRIKHNKGLVSKEKKSMHRDKNVKAHDRGAAKEKALKERTQIEFFEREQIVDDEFEKAKKSNANSNWQSGHDSKKAIQAADLTPDDTDTSGGSHYVNHRGPNEKSHTVGAEQTSGKKSSKSERRHLEAKGKKFKGWREKGYKIITETEFIDRGSLHDSAYRKRDKGSASQQKYRRQQSASEGQHGSSVDQQKRLHKKEERRSDAKQTKESRGREESKADRARNKKSSAKKPTGVESNDIEISGSNKWEQLRQKRHPGLLSASATTFRPGQDESPPNALLRLLSSTHHEQHPEDALQSLNTSHKHNRKLSNKLDVPDEPEMAERRVDVAAGKENTGRTKGWRSVEERHRTGNNNGTLLDIVDNSTGRQVNKTRIGTYELSQDDEHSIRGSSNNSIPLSKIANSLARYSAYLSRSQAANRSTTSSPIVRSKNTERPQVDTNRMQQQQQQQHPTQRQAMPSGGVGPNYNQNQHYNFDLMEHKRQLEARAAHQQLSPYPPMVPPQVSSNQTPLPDKQASMASHPRQLMRPDQAEAAAQILRLMQQAASMKEQPVQAPMPVANYMDILHRSALMAPPGPSYAAHHLYGTGAAQGQQPLARPLTFMAPSPLSYGLNPFGPPTQFADYEPQAHTFLGAE